MEKERFKMKLCKDCSVLKPIAEFPKKECVCKKCKTERTRKWRANNPERYLANKRKWSRENYAKNPEKTKERLQKWRDENPARFLEVKQKSYQNRNEKRKHYR